MLIRNQQRTRCPQFLSPEPHPLQLKVGLYTFYDPQSDDSAFNLGAVAGTSGSPREPSGDQPKRDSDRGPNRNWKGRRRAPLSPEEVKQQALAQSAAARAQNAKKLTIYVSSGTDPLRSPHTEPKYKRRRPKTKSKRGRWIVTSSRSTPGS